jgi:hypothetical protein
MRLLPLTHFHFEGSMLPIQATLASGIAFFQLQFAKIGVDHVTQALSFSILSFPDFLPAMIRHGGGIQLSY